MILAIGFIKQEPASFTIFIIFFFVIRTCYFREVSIHNVALLTFFVGGAILGFK
ncbi:hypothetical protein KHA80_03310 [Anaerobacillus sp. HL2]|nr:hypothetical protein KHA80_03310 [Anaerobacillus sp. HL2]